MPIKHIKKIALAAALVGQFLAVGAASAANLTFSADTNVSTTNPAATLVVKSGSAATSLVVNSGSIVVVMPVSATFTITGSSNQITTSNNGLTGTLTVTDSCSINQLDTLTITSSASATDTVTMVPLSYPCTTPGGGTAGSSGSTGGSVSGGSTSQNTAKTATVNNPATAPVVTQPAYLAPVISPSAFLSFGIKGNDVRKLQEFLAKDKSIYPQGTVTGFYGSLTMRAVEKFQEKYGLAKKGDAGYGRVGPKTRAKINELGGQGKSVSTSGANDSIAAQIQALWVKVNGLLKQLKK